MCRQHGCNTFPGRHNGFRVRGSVRESPVDTMTSVASLRWSGIDDRCGSSTRPTPGQHPKENPRGSWIDPTISAASLHENPGRIHQWPCGSRCGTTRIRGVT